MAQSPYMATLLSGDTDVCEFQHNEYLVYQWLTGVSQPVYAHITNTVFLRLDIVVTQSEALHEKNKCCLKIVAMTSICCRCTCMPVHAHIIFLRIEATLEW